ncbi:lipid IV(A) 3-deoxy-D-manno-octulosonic acid transferase [Francisella adeliensis]|uniref:3-deoxy-D-manno-octulosonic acid transferase n=1 Tax=Francisella adeliensis TaxID=2007306 RepID=A0A2Z4Y0K1_9GAMM|nr:lipid IV(A) 3-deoxy-D-manno-octulosonic acid transferase [Francisella adeliensis]AXA34406.1 3-deoxy-D-manno-octulosonic acid transferase [Francisella adeliensis]MBK2086498.1 lipid IV(A) 3-deoxy-D-manno-octulosonic acid transferase [Francisella adeliensis]MBK2096126.1 lipid IV(A) 3-deoxy-D-manno-octulosonic acid transferase [Francisella adeliensis]QIW12652.1 3-deoxy-D-manno-octulosonic acid transferase [Francisella adeliensis]QIW14527.1 3-deoxy-D-manno-octulosonic acid transferase [Francisel
MDNIKKIIYNILTHLYSSLFLVYIPIVYLKKLKRSLNNNQYRLRWSERFAITPLRLKDSIWIHSVSVGESLSAEPLVRKLLNDFPNENIVITTTTPTGSDVIRRLYDNHKNVHHMYIPYDVKPFINSFFAKVDPKLFIVIETEIWPNILGKCFAEDIPVVITNARLSKKSLRNYKKIPFGGEMLFSKVSHICTQTEKDTKRFLSLGVQKDKVSTTGNLKYNLVTPKDLANQTHSLKESIKHRAVWVAGSTHSGEESIILEAHKEILKTNPDCLLIIVPRHKERFCNVEKIISNNNLTLQKRSSNKEEIDEKTQVYLGDTMGELLQLYFIADITFMGGTLIDNGGHNLLEPAALRKPIISGTSLYNFSQISKALIRNKALIRVRNSQELATNISNLIKDKQKCSELADNSYKTFQAHGDVLDLQYNQITKFLCQK